LHTTIPKIVVENARVDPRSRRPDPLMLTSHIDPPRYTPSPKEDVTLPRSTDTASTWIWISKWSVSRHEGPSDINGWRYAQRWDAPTSEWVDNPSILTPISRSGLVSRRTWVRIMKRCPAGETYVGNIDSSDTDLPDLPDLPSQTPAKSTSRTQPTRANSMSARLVNLVVGSSKGK
jgi:hypothetical protein